LTGVLSWEETTLPPPLMILLSMEAIETLIEERLSFLVWESSMLPQLLSLYVPQLLFEVLAICSQGLTLEPVEPRVSI